MKGPLDYLGYFLMFFGVNSSKNIYLKIIAFILRIIFLFGCFLAQFSAILKILKNSNLWREISALIRNFSCVFLFLHYIWKRKLINQILVDLEPFFASKIGNNLLRRSFMKLMLIWIIVMLLLVVMGALRLSATVVLPLIEYTELTNSSHTDFIQVLIAFESYIYRMGWLITTKIIYMYFHLIIQNGYELLYNEWSQTEFINRNYIKRISSMTLNFNNLRSLEDKFINGLNVWPFIWFAMCYVETTTRLMSSAKQDFTEQNKLVIIFVEWNRCIILIVWLIIFTLSAHNITQNKINIHRKLIDLVSIQEFIDPKTKAACKKLMKTLKENEVSDINAYQMFYVNRNILLSFAINSITFAVMCLSLKK